MDESQGGPRAWQVENKTWLIKGWSSWDEMRRAAYGNLHSITAPRAERPELVSRFRKAGLTQRETAETLGVSRDTVKRNDEPTYKPRVANGANAPFTPEPDDVIDAEVIEDDDAEPSPHHVNTMTGEVIDDPPPTPELRRGRPSSQRLGDHSTHSRCRRALKCLPALHLGHWR